MDWGDVDGGKLVEVGAIGSAVAIGERFCTCLRPFLHLTHSRSFDQFSTSSVFIKLSFHQFSIGFRHLSPRFAGWEDRVHARLQVGPRGRDPPAWWGLDPRRCGVAGGHMTLTTTDGTVFSTATILEWMHLDVYTWGFGPED